MELSIREAKARFTEAAAARGERVAVTRYSRPFVEIVPAGRSGGMDFDRAAQIRNELGIDGVTIELADDFDSPELSRSVLGLDD